MMKRILKDNTGSIMVEAAIYYPIIIIAVICVIMLCFFKLDKIMTQANLSIKTKDVQVEMTQEDVYTYKYAQAMSDNSALDDKRILDVAYSNSRVYQWGHDGYTYPVVGVDYAAQYKLDFMGLIPITTSHGFLVKHSPYHVSMAMHDVSMYKEIVEFKTGYIYSDYLKMQYGY